MMDAAINPSSNMLARESLAETVLETTRAPVPCRRNGALDSFRNQPPNTSPQWGRPNGVVIRAPLPPVEPARASARAWFRAPFGPGPLVIWL